MHTFYQLGKNMHFTPFFYPLSIIFSPNLLFGRTKKIYTPAILVKVQIQLITTIVNITVRFIIDSF